jgi:hypothetical protein
MNGKKDYLKVNEPDILLFEGNQWTMYQAR